MKIARILLDISETNGPYNEFTLPFSHQQDITLILKDRPTLSLSEDIKLIHSEGHLFKFLGTVIAASKQENYDFFHIHHANLAAFSWIIKLFGGSSAKNEIVFTLGTCFQNLRFRHKLFTVVGFTAIDHFVCCGQAVYDSIPWFLKSLFGKKISIIKYGINIERTTRFFLDNSQKKPNSLVVATRLIKAKYVDEILDALAQSDFPWTLDIAGAGVEEHNLKQYSKKLHLENSVNFCGSLTRDSVLELMANRQFYISASATDGMPIAVLEAIGAGCIPILVDSDPHLEFVEEGFFAIIFRRRDQQSFKDALATASMLDSIRIEEIVSANFENLRSKFSCEVMMKEYESLVEGKQLDLKETVPVNE